MNDQMPLIRALKRAMDLGMDPSSLMSLLTPGDVEALKAEWAKAYAIQEPDFSGQGEVTKEIVMAWLDTQKAIYGDTLPVEPLQPGEHEYRDALQELDQIAGTRPVITAHVPP